MQETLMCILRSHSHRTHVVAFHCTAFPFFLCNRTQPKCLTIVLMSWVTSQRQLQFLYTHQHHIYIHSILCLLTSCCTHLNNHLNCFVVIQIKDTFVLEQTRLCFVMCAHTIQRWRLFVCPILASDAPAVRGPVVMLLLVLDQDLPHQLLGAWELLTRNQL